MMIRYLIILKIFLFIVFADCHSVYADDQSDIPVILQLSWHHQFEYAGFYAALDKGFYQEEGINRVVIKPGGTGLDEAELVSSGQAHFGVMSSELIVKRVNGMPIVLLAAIMQHSKRALIVRSDSGIFTPQDFIGRTIMLNIHEHEEFLAMFIHEGVEPERIKIIHKDQTAIKRMIDGTIDGINGSTGNQPLTLTMQGVSTRLIRPINYGIDFYGNSLFTSESELEGNPDLVAAFRRASIKGWEYAMAHPEEIIDLIREEYNKEKSPEQLRFEAEQLRKAILPDLVDIGHINPGRWRRIADTYAELGIIPPDYSLDGFFYNPDQRRKEFIERFQKIFYITSAISICLIILVFIWILSLRRTVASRTVELTEEITAHKKTLGGLIESEAQWRSLTETSPDHILTLDTDLNIKYANSAALGLTVEELVGTPLYQYVEGSEQQEEVKATLQRVLQTSEQRTYETYYKIAGEGRGYFESRVVPRKIEGSDIPVGLTVSSRDITERRKFESEIESLKNFYQHILNNVEEGIWVADSEDVLIFFNQGMEKIAGVRQEDALGLVVTRDFPKETLQHFIQFFTKAKENLQVQQYESAVVTPMGRSTIQSGYLVPRIKNGKYDGMICTIIDITERKQAEDQIKSNLKEKETLLQEIHHRVKNNMQVIASLLELQSNSIQDQQVRNALKESRNRVYALSAIHETLHESDNLSKIGLRNYLSKITTAVFDTYLTTRGRIKLNKEVEKCAININQASTLGLIINELVSNALKYAFPDNRKGELSVRLCSSGNEIELIVSDDGVGFPGDLDWRMTNSLGLKLVQTLAENQLGGSIDLNRDKGTSFRIKFNIEA